MSARIAFLVGISFVVWALTTLKLDSRQDEFERNVAIIDANIARIDGDLRAIRKNLGVIEGSTAADVAVESCIIKGDSICCQPGTTIYDRPPQ
jgi:hypothetical protein